MIKKAFFLLFIILLGILITRGAFNIGKASKLAEETQKTQSQPQYPTGQDVLAELNVYRVANDLPPFKLSERLCNNIHERWKVYVEKESHEGLEEFVQREMPGSQVGEIMVYGETAKQMVERWSSSPSHDLLVKKYSKICVYSALGSSVALLSN